MAPSESRVLASTGEKHIAQFFFPGYPVIKDRSTKWKKIISKRCLAKWCQRKGKELKIFQQLKANLFNTPSFLLTGHLTFRCPESPCPFWESKGVYAISTWPFEYTVWQKWFVAHQKFKLTLRCVELSPITYVYKPSIHVVGAMTSSLSKRRKVEVRRTFLGQLIEEVSLPFSCTPSSSTG